MNLMDGSSDIVLLNIQTLGLTWSTKDTHAHIKGQHQGLKKEKNLPVLDK